MTFFFRADSSLEIGTGHIVRCLTLALKLQTIGITSVFICRPYAGNISNQIRNLGFRIIELPHRQNHMDSSGFQEIDVLETLDKLKNESTKDAYLVVDHYKLDFVWEKRVKEKFLALIIIDDMSSRKHDCEVLIDANLDSRLNNKYLGLVPPTCKLFLGPHYALLREEFVQLRKKTKPRSSGVKNILVFFGGTDLDNTTAVALNALSQLPHTFAVSVVVGENNPHKENIRNLCTEQRFHFYQQTPELGRLMLESDLALGASGTSTWERCYLGLPTILVAIAENQVRIAEETAAVGAAVYLGKREEISSEDISKAVREFLRDKNKLESISKKALLVIGDNPTKELTNSLCHYLKIPLPIEGVK